jgi:hypothetical protein
MCGGTSWEEQGWKPYAALFDDRAAAGIDEAADEDASAPLRREASEIDAPNILPGVPFS